MSILSRDQILKPDVRPTLELVPVPEWGDGAEVYVGVISGRQRDRVEAAIQAGMGNARPKESIRAILSAFAIRDADNRPLFTEADVAALGDLPSLGLDRIFKAAIRVNKMGGEADVEVEAKKSEDETS